MTKHKIVNMTPIGNAATQTAMKFIMDYLADTLLCTEIPTNLDNIPLASTDLEGTDEELFIQVNADLINAECRTYISSEDEKDSPVLVSTIHFPSLLEMNQNFLQYLDFDSLIAVTEDEIDTFCRSKPGIQWLRKKYPSDTKIVLDYMNDPYPVEPGTIGTIKYIDDIGSIHVAWQSGSSLALNYAKDQFHIL